MPADRDDAPLTAMERALVRALISAICTPRRGACDHGDGRTAGDPSSTQSTGGGGMILTSLSSLSSTSVAILVAAARAPGGVLLKHVIATVARDEQADR